ncbi:MAG TPA: hypothetical protein VFX59_31695 [Polyangiales bacterium]|nr:hypothetical protein [Polyangiales bacterium]
MTRVLVAGFIVLRATAQAQAPDPGRELEMIESTERGEDPLGIDDSTRSLSQVVLPKQREVLPKAQQGAALSAIAGVRELKHTLGVALDHGLATVNVRMTFVSTAKHPAELAYRLPLPAGAQVTHVSEQVEAITIDDARGHALALRMGPISKELSVEVTFMAEAPLHGGRARFQLDGRGYDPNLAPTELSVTSKTLKLDDVATTLDPWLPIALQGTLTRRDVASGPCSRRYEATPLGPPLVRATHLYIDASPSMEGPARSRLTPALAALLSVLPDATPLRAFAFASRAEELGRYEAGDAPLIQLTDAAMHDLGASTAISALDAKARVIVLSDGIFDQARKLGPDSWLVQLVDGPASKLFANTLNVSAEAEAALHGDLSALEDRLRAIVSHRTGEQHVTGGCASTRSFTRAPIVEARGSSAREQNQAIAAIPYVDVPPPPPPDYTGMPKESVLSMLRTQLVPQARACLRSDRKGRGDYAVALTFNALFAQREIYEPRITGDIPPALRSCLGELLPKLRVPAFTGRIRVRYPIFTEREAAEPAIELEPETSQKLERAFGGTKALP